MPNPLWPLPFLTIVENDQSNVNRFPGSTVLTPNQLKISYQIEPTKLQFKNK